MYSHAAKVLLIILLAISLCGSYSIASEHQSLEYRLKALYILRLTHFISWPENSEKTVFNVCIDLTSPVAIELQNTEIIELKGRRLEVIAPPENEAVKQCDFLYFIGEDVDPEISQFSVMTVSSDAGFAKRGGMIEFYIDQSKVRMKANLQAIATANITLSSKLLRLLLLVEQEEGHDD